MKKYFSILMVLCGLFIATNTTWAIPTLQLDIAGGTYDPVTETIVTNSSTFTLYALLNGRVLPTTYFISAALVPKTSAASSSGSFVFDGDTIQVTGDMEYGMPSLLNEKHGIFETFYKQFRFYFNPINEAKPYNVEDNPGQGPIAQDPGENDIFYYAAFTVDVSGLAQNYGIHFDLYSYNDFAPFSHDAEYRQIPEPGILILLGLGLIGIIGIRKK